LPLVIPAALVLRTFFIREAIPGTKPLTALVTALVAANVLLFVGVSIAAGTVG
jgi:hypothetical protein